MINTADIIDRLSKKPYADFNACIGLDGFVDRIIRVVDKRRSAGECSYVRTLADYGRLISDASGFSLNVELICEKSQLGGNGPIMAYALARLGSDVSCIGAFGLPRPAAEFEKLEKLARLYSLSEPARTDDYEFDDGKIIASTLNSWNAITEKLPPEQICALFDEADVIALNNWTMIPAMTGIWKRIQSDTLPSLSDKERLYFIDMADPGKRTDADIAEALRVMAGFERFGRTVLSCNHREAIQLAGALELSAPPLQMAYGKASGYGAYLSTRSRVRLPRQCPESPKPPAFTLRSPVSPSAAGIISTRGWSLRSWTDSRLRRHCMLPRPSPGPMYGQE